MMSNGMPVLSLISAESLILAKLREFRIELKAPIPIERIIQKFDASIDAMPCLTSVQGVEAMIRRIRGGGEGKKFRVVVDREILEGPLPYLRLVLAEEAAHFLADHNTLLTVKTTEDLIEIHRDPEWVTRERNREAIGRIWLAPSELLERVAHEAYSYAADHAGFGREFDATFEARCARELKMPVDHLQQRIMEVHSDLHARIQASKATRSIALAAIYKDERRAKKHSTPTFPSFQ